MPTIDLLKAAASTTAANHNEAALTTATTTAAGTATIGVETILFPYFNTPNILRTPLITTTSITTTTTTTPSTSAHFEQYQQRLQLYNYALHIERFRCTPFPSATPTYVHSHSHVHQQQTAAAAAAMAMAAMTATTAATIAKPNHQHHPSHHYQHQQQQQQQQQLQQQQRFVTTMHRSAFLPQSAATFSRLFHHEEPKPQHSYIGLIAMAILSSPDSKLVLSDIYQYILDNYPYFRTRGPGWRNSIRHNLSLNDCFVKSGRSANGKGHYWSIHPANLDDFRKGDFRRRKAQRKVRRHMGLAVDDNGTDSPSPPPTLPAAPTALSPTLTAMNYAKLSFNTAMVGGLTTPNAAAALLAAATIQKQQQLQPALPTTTAIEQQGQQHGEDHQSSSARIVEYYSQHLATTFEHHHHHHHYHQQQQQRQLQQQQQTTSKFQGLMTMAEMLNYSQRQPPTPPQLGESINQQQEYNNNNSSSNNNNYNIKYMISNSHINKGHTETTSNQKRQFDVASLLAPDVKQQNKILIYNKSIHIGEEESELVIEEHTDRFGEIVKKQHLIAADDTEDDEIDEDEREAECDLMIDVVAHEDDDEDDDDVVERREHENHVDVDKEMLVDNLETLANTSNACYQLFYRHQQQQHLNVIDDQDEEEVVVARHNKSNKDEDKDHTLVI